MQRTDDGENEHRSHADQIHEIVTSEWRKSLQQQEAAHYLATQPQCQVSWTLQNTWPKSAAARPMLDDSRWMGKHHSVTLKFVRSISRVYFCQARRNPPCAFKTGASGGGIPCRVGPETNACWTTRSGGYRSCWCWWHVKTDAAAALSPQAPSPLKAFSFSAFLVLCRLNLGASEHRFCDGFTDWVCVMTFRIGPFDWRCFLWSTNMACNIVSTTFVCWYLRRFYLRFSVWHLFRWNTLIWQASTPTDVGCEKKVSQTGTFERSSTWEFESADLQDGKGVFVGPPWGRGSQMSWPYQTWGASANPNRSQVWSLVTTYLRGKDTKWGLTWSAESDSATPGQHKHCSEKCDRFGPIKWAWRTSLCILTSYHEAKLDTNGPSTHLGTRSRDVFVRVHSRCKNDSCEIIRLFETFGWEKSCMIEQEPF